MELFADAQPGADGRMALLLFVASMIGGAATYVVNLALKVRSDNKAEADGEKKSIVEHKQQLIDRLDKENAELVKEKDQMYDENRKLVEKCGKCDVRSARMRTHIRYLEFVLARNSLSFERYEEEDDSGSNTHAPLPPSPPAPPPSSPPNPKAP